jgi:pimeloyl-ACP methyl ester carboxylesterase
VGDRGGRSVKGVVSVLVLCASAAGTVPLGVKAAPIPALERRTIETKSRKTDLGRCRNVPQARCGSIKVRLDREDPSMGKIKIGFMIYPHTDRSRPKKGTIVAVEGGPGYASTKTAPGYRKLFRPVLNRYNLLLVDNRGTGRSEAILCQPLQSYTGDYENNAGKCGRQLDGAADLYGTHNAVDDMAAVLNHLNIKRVDMYGDSYGTFFGQTFAIRHPDRLKSLVLDSAYFVGGTDPFYLDTNRAMRDAFRYACERRPSCATREGSTNARIRQMTRFLRRHPITGRAPNAEGVFKKVTVDVEALANMMYSGSTSTAFYRELDAAIRAALRPDHYYKPILRLARESTYEGGAGYYRAFSEGLYVAVACNDYPAPFDVTAPFKVRRQQYRGALDVLRQTPEREFAPFTVTEWVKSGGEYYDDCIKWPRPSRIDPPVPPDAVYPDVPVLVLAGDFDALTSPEGAIATAAAFPNSTYVEVANMTHVTAISDFGRCTSDIVVRFVRTHDAGDTSCARNYQEARLVDKFALRAKGLGLPPGGRGTAMVGAMTVADVMARWWNMFGATGVGLQGGRFTTDGLVDVTWDLRKVRYVEDVAVSGRVSWSRATGAITTDVRVTGTGVKDGTLTITWNDWDQLAKARAVGTVGGREVDVRFLAP